MTSRETVFGFEHADGVSSEETEYYEKAIRPFTDDAFLAQRIEAKNRYIRTYPELTEQITATLQGDDDQSILDTVESVTMAREIRELELAKPPLPTAVLLDHLNFCRDINYLKIDAVGFKNPTDRVNAIMTLTAKDIVKSVPEEQLREYAYSAGFIHGQLSSGRLKEYLQDDEAWYATKIGAIKIMLEHRHFMISYIKSLPGDDTEQVTDEQVEEDTAAITALFQQALKARRYGVKIGYKEQKHRTGSLVFAEIPPMDEYESKNLHPLTLFDFDTALASVNDSPDTSFSKRISFERQNEGYGVKEGNTSYAVNVNSRASLTLREDGRLTSAIEFEGMENLAKAKNKYSAFRRLQAEILADFVDLVTPIENSIEARRIEKSTVQPISYSDEAAVDIVGRLLIPRIKAGKSIEGSGELDEIIANDSKENESKQELRLHGVVWHIRQLPEGWNASPDAVAMAQEAGITLRKNETFVRSHERGTKKVGEVATHAFISRH